MRLPCVQPVTFGALLALSACLGDENDELRLEAIDISPRVVQLRSNGVTLPEQRFRVEGVYQGGRREDLTTTATFALTNAALGSMNGPVFRSSGAGGSTSVLADVQGFVAQAQIDVLIPEDPDTDVAGALPASPEAVVDGAMNDASLEAPEIAYPAPGTMIPRNMPPMEIHWEHNLPDVNGSPRFTAYGYNYACHELPPQDRLGSPTSVKTVPPPIADPQEFFPHTGLRYRPRIYTTRILVPASGTYTFTVEHRDSVLLEVAGQEVLRWQGRSGIRSTSGTVNLTAGSVDFVMTVAVCGPGYDRGEYRAATYDRPAVNRDPNHELKVFWEGPSLPKTFVEPQADVVTSDYSRSTPMPQNEAEIEPLAISTWQGNQSTIPGSLGAQQARIIRGTFGALTDGDYRFSLYARTFARLYIDDQLVIDNGRPTSYRTDEATVSLTRGSHSFRLVVIAYRWSRLRLEWAPPGQTDLSSMEAQDLGTPDRPFVLPNPQIYQVRILGTEVDIKAHTRCRRLPGGSFSHCYYEVPPGLWALITDTESGTGQPVRVSVTRVDETDNVRSTSLDTELTVAAARVDGAVYYWDTSQRGILRTTFGSAEPPEYFWPKPQGTDCGGCHALSPSGTRLAVGIVPGVSQIIQTDFDIVDIAAQAPLFKNANGVTVEAQRKASFFAWNPTGEEFVATLDGDDVLRVRAADSGEETAVFGMGLRATHPDWAPDGQTIAFIDYSGGNGAHPERGRVMLSTKSSGAWSNPLEVAARESGVTYTSPSFAPTSDFMVVARSRCSNGQDGGSDCDGYLDFSGRLNAVRRTGGAPIDLVNANARGILDRSDGRLRYSYPKFAPFIDAANRDGSGRVTWVMFSARRRYGARPRGQNNTLLWMAAIDPDAIARGEDGSFAPFVFPNQLIDRSNLHAFWARQLITAPVDPTDPMACLPEGAECTPTGQSCCSELRCELGTGTRTTCLAPF
ncbi:MAG: PA14 domain-containing protein [Myxococcota bacterium]